MSELTSEEMGRLRVPLDALPGLPCRGLLLYAHGPSRTVELAQTDVLPDDRGTAMVRVRGDMWPAYDWLIDLSDAATADRVARWLAGRVGLACTEGYRWHASWRGFWELYATRPDASYARGEPTWFEVHVGDFSCARLTGPPPWAVPVPSLATLDPADPRLLPDGSRWVDRAALACVCAHVGRTG